ncbi:NucA/NucB deoxyribonuclease domain-containing protein [Nonomuraea sp. NPDC051191]|uniref:NucA/NucB deoxyribonuclease domain-containing protein n=1 Tax=Nonomuraea sp. NPDC051191 TaxID=3364372 RepID=UPI0037A798A7
MTISVGWLIVSESMLPSKGIVIHSLRTVIRLVGAIVLSLAFLSTPTHASSSSLNIPDDNPKSVEMRKWAATAMADSNKLQPEPYGSPNPAIAQSKIPTCAQVRANPPTISAEAREAGRTAIWCRNTDTAQRTNAEPPPPAPPAEIPDWCRNEFGTAWVTDRAFACKRFIDDYDILQPPLMDKIGRIKFAVWDMIYTSPIRDYVVHRNWVAPFIVEGEAVRSGRWLHEVCDTQCALDSASGTGRTALTLNQWTLGEAIWDSTVSARKSAKIYTTMDVWLTHPATPDIEIPNELDGSHPIRCDNQVLKGSDSAGSAYTHGCVFSQFVPILIFSRSQLPELTDHIGWATLTRGLAGLYGSGFPLHRIVDDADINGNRDTACENAPDPRPSGQSCDEYPMASTLEGAETGGGFYSCRMINAVQNSTGGGIQGAFENTKRLLDMDAFYVYVDPPYTSSPPNKNDCT